MTNETEGSVNLSSLGTASESDMKSALSGQPETVKSSVGEATPAIPEDNSLPTTVPETPEYNIDPLDDGLGDMSYTDKDGYGRMFNRAGSFVGGDLDQFGDEGWVSGLDKGFTFTGWEDTYDRSQSAQGVWEKARNGAIAFVGDVAFETSKGLAMIPGAVNMLIQGDFTALFDNTMQNSLDSWQEDYDQYFGIKRGGSQSTTQKTANFLFDDVLGAFSFVIGAIATEAILTAATVSTLGGASGVQAVATAGIVAKGARIAKVMLSGGKRVLKGQFIDDAIKGFSALGKSATRKTALAGIKAAGKQGARTAGINSVGKIGRQMLTGGGMEAGVEARTMMNAAGETHRQQYEDINGKGSYTDEMAAEFRDSISGEADAVFGMNLVLVSMSNMLMFPRLFGAPMRSGMKAVRTVKKSGLSSKGRKAAAKAFGTTEEALPELLDASRGTRVGRNLRRFRGVGVGAYEGFVEEGLQGVMGRGGEHYIAEKYNPANTEKTANMSKAFMEGFKGSYATADGFTEIAMGFALGFLGVPNVLRIKSTNADGKEYTPWMVGGISSRREEQVLKDKAVDTILRLHKEKGNVVSILEAELHNMNTQKGLADQVEEAYANNDFKGGKDIEADQIFSHATSKITTGRFDDAILESKEILDDMSIDEFRDLMGAEALNMSDDELRSRKQKVHDTYVKKMHKVKDAYDEASSIYKGDNPDVYVGVANIVYSIKDRDAREADLANTIAEELKSLNGDEVLSSSRMVSDLFITADDIEELVNLDDKIRRIDKQLKTKLDRRIIKNIDSEKASIRSSELERLEEARAEALDKQEAFQGSLASRSKIEGKYEFDVDEQLLRFQSIVDMNRALKFSGKSVSNIDIVALRETVQDLYEISADREVLIARYNDLIEPGGYNRFINSMKESIASMHTITEEELSSIEQAELEKREQEDEHEEQVNPEPGEVREEEAGDTSQEIHGDQGPLEGSLAPEFDGQEASPYDDLTLQGPAVVVDGPPEGFDATIPQVEDPATPPASPVPTAAPLSAATVPEEVEGRTRHVYPGVAPALSAFKEVLKTEDPLLIIPVLVPLEEVLDDWAEDSKIFSLESFKEEQDIYDLVAAVKKDLKLKGYEYAIHTFKPLTKEIEESAGSIVYENRATLSIGATQITNTFVPEIKKDGIVVVKAKLRVLRGPVLEAPGERTSVPDTRLGETAAIKLVLDDPALTGNFNPALSGAQDVAVNGIKLGAEVVLQAGKIQGSIDLIYRGRKIGYIKESLVSSSGISDSDLEAISNGRGIKTYVSAADVKITGGTRVIGRAPVTSRDKNGRYVTTYEDITKTLTAADAVHSVEDIKFIVFVLPGSGGGALIQDAVDDYFVDTEIPDFKSGKAVQSGRHYMIVKDHNTQEDAYVPLEGTKVGMPEAEFIFQASLVIDVVNGVLSLEKAGMTQKSLVNSIKALKTLGINLEFSEGIELSSTEKFNNKLQYEKLLQTLTGYVSNSGSSTFYKSPEYLAKTKGVNIIAYLTTDSGRIEIVTYDQDNTEPGEDYKDTNVIKVSRSKEEGRAVVVDAISRINRSATTVGRETNSISEGTEWPLSLTLGEDGELVAEDFGSYKSFLASRLKVTSTAPIKTQDSEGNNVHVLSTYPTIKLKIAEVVTLEEDVIDTESGSVTPEMQEEQADGIAAITRQVIPEEVLGEVEAQRVREANAQQAIDDIIGISDDEDFLPLSASMEEGLEIEGTNMGRAGKLYTIKGLSARQVSYTVNIFTGKASSLLLSHSLSYKASMSLKASAIERSIRKDLEAQRDILLGMDSTPKIENILAMYDKVLDPTSFRELMLHTYLNLLRVGNGIVTGKATTVTEALNLLLNENGVEEEGLDEDAILNAENSLAAFDANFAFGTRPNDTLKFELKMQFLATQHTTADALTRTPFGLKYIDFETLGINILEVLSGVAYTWEAVESRLLDNVKDYPYFSALLEALDLNKVADKDTPTGQYIISKRKQMRQQLIAFGAKDSAIFFSTKLRKSVKGDFMGNGGNPSRVYIFSSNNRNQERFIIPQATNKLVSHGFYTIDKDGGVVVSRDRVRLFLKRLDSITSKSFDHKNKASKVSALLYKEMGIKIPWSVFSESEMPGIEYDFKSDGDIGHKTVFGLFRKSLRTVLIEGASIDVNLLTGIDNKGSGMSLFMLAAKYDTAFIQKSSRDIQGKVRYQHSAPKLITQRLNEVKAARGKSDYMIDVGNYLFKMASQTVGNEKMRIDYLDGIAEMGKEDAAKDFHGMSDGDRNLFSLVNYGNSTEQYVGRSKKPWARHMLPTLSDKKSMPLMNVESISTIFKAKTGVSKEAFEDISIKSFITDAAFKTYYRKYMYNALEVEMTRINTLRGANGLAAKKRLTKAQRSADAFLFIPELTSLLPKGTLTAKNKRNLHTAAAGMLYKSLDMDFKAMLYSLKDTVFTLKDGVIESIDYLDPRVEGSEFVLTQLGTELEALSAAPLEVPAGLSVREQNAINVQSDELTDININDAILAFIAKYQFDARAFKTNSTLMFIGDPGAFWKGNPEKTMSNASKRFAGLIAPGTAIPEVSWYLIDSEGKKIARSNKNISILPIKDKFTTSSLLPYYKKLGLSKEEQDTYRNMEASDGAELVTAEEHLSVFLAQGVMTENVFRKLVAKAKDPNAVFRKDEQGWFNPQKPVTAGRVGEAMVYIKSAQFPLVASLHKGTELDKLRVFMEEHNINRAVHSSAFKVGDISEEMTNIYDIKEGIKIDKTEVYTSVVTFPRHNMRIQQEQPVSHSTDKPHASQIAKLWLVNLAKAHIGGFVVPGLQEPINGKELHEMYMEARSKELTLKIEKFAKKHSLGIEMRGSRVKLTATDGYKESLAKRMMEEAIARGYSNVEIGHLHYDKVKQEFSTPLWASMTSKQVDNLLFSILYKDVIQPRIAGFSGAIRPELGVAWSSVSEATASSITWVSKGGKLLFDKKRLKTQHLKEDGTIQPDQILMPWKYKVRLEAYTKDGVIDMDQLPEELIKVFAYRIPGQKKASTGSFEIVGFLPLEMGDTLIVSDELVGRIGQDYDIDKMYGMMYQLKVNKDTGAVEVIRDGNAETISEKIHAARNTMIDLYHAAMLNPDPEVQKEVHAPVSDGYAAPLAEILESQNIPDLLHPMSVSYNNMKANRASSAGDSIGLFASFNVMHSQLEQLPDDLPKGHFGTFVMTPEGPIHKFVVVSIDKKPRHKGMTMEEHKANKVGSLEDLSRLGKTDILDTEFVMTAVNEDIVYNPVAKTTQGQISMLLNHALDDANNGLLPKLGIVKEARVMAVALTAMGYNEETIALFVSSPITLEYFTLLREGDKVGTSLKGAAKNSKSILQALIAREFSRGGFTDFTSVLKTINLNKETLKQQVLGTLKEDIIDIAHNIQILKSIQTLNKASLGLSALQKNFKFDTKTPADRGDFLTIMSRNEAYGLFQSMGTLPEYQGEVFYTLMSAPGDMQGSSWERIKAGTVAGSVTSAVEDIYKDIIFIKGEHIEETSLMSDIFKTLKTTGTENSYMDIVKAMKSYISASWAEDITGIGAEDLRASYLESPVGNIADKVLKAIAAYPEVAKNIFIKQLIPNTDLKEHGFYTLEFTGDTNILVSSQEMLGGFLDLVTSEDLEVRQLAEELLVYSLITGGVLSSRGYGKYILPEYLQDMPDAITRKPRLELGVRAMFSPQSPRFKGDLSTKEHRNMMGQIFAHNPSLAPMRVVEKIFYTSEEGGAQKSGKIIKLGKDAETLMKLGYIRYGKTLYEVTGETILFKDEGGEDTAGIIVTEVFSKGVTKVGDYISSQYSRDKEDPFSPERIRGKTSYALGPMAGFELGEGMDVPADLDQIPGESQSQGYSIEEDDISSFSPIMGGMSMEELEAMEISSLSASEKVTKPVVKLEEVSTKPDVKAKEEALGLKKTIQVPVKEDKGERIPTESGTPLQGVVDALFPESTHFLLGSFLKLEAKLPVGKRIKFSPTASGVLASYNSREHTIKYTKGNEGGMTEAELAHELVHAYTVIAANNASKYSQEVRDLLEEIDSVRKHIFSNQKVLEQMGIKPSELAKYQQGFRISNKMRTQNVIFRGMVDAGYTEAEISNYRFFMDKDNQKRMHGFVNLKEFMAEALSNPVFAKQLSKVQYDSKRTFLQKIVSFVSNVLVELGVLSKEGSAGYLVAANTLTIMKAVAAERGIVFNEAIVSKEDSKSGKTVHSEDLLPDSTRDLNVFTEKDIETLKSYKKKRIRQFNEVKARFKDNVLLGRMVDQRVSLERLELNSLEGEVKVSTIVGYANRELDNVEKVLGAVSLKGINMDEIQSAIQDTLSVIEFYENLRDLSSVSAAGRKELATLQGRAKNLRSEYLVMSRSLLRSYAKNRFKGTATEAFVNSESFLEMENISTLSAQFMDASRQGRIEFSFLDKVIKDSNAEQRQDFTRRVDKYNKLSKKFKESRYYKKWGWAGLVERDFEGEPTSKIINPLSGKWERLAEAQRKLASESGDWKPYFKWLKESTGVINVAQMYTIKDGVVSRTDNPAILRSLDRTYGKLGAQEALTRQDVLMEQYASLRQAEFDFIDVGEGTLESKVEAKALWEAQNSPSAAYKYRIKTAYAPKGTRNRFLYRIPLKKIAGKDTGYYDTRFQDLQEEDSAVEYYKYIRDQFKELMGTLPIHAMGQDRALMERGLFLPAIRKQLTLDFWDVKSKWRRFKDNSFGAIMSTEQELESTLIDPVTGEVRRELSTRYLQAFAEKGEQEYDMDKVFAEFAMMATSYKAKNKIEDLVTMTDAVLKHVGMSQLDGKKDRVSIKGFNLVSKSPDRRGNILTVVKTLVDDFYGKKVKEPMILGSRKPITEQDKKTEAYIKEQLLEAEKNFKAKIITEVEYHETEEVLQEKLSKVGGYFDMAKIIRVLTKFMQLKGMGWNAPAATVNAVFGTMSVWRWAAGHEDFDEETTRKAQAVMMSATLNAMSFSQAGDRIKNVKKIQNMMMKLNILKDFTEVKWDATKASDLKETNRWLDKIKPYHMQKTSEYLVYGLGSVSHLMYQKVDGVSLWEAMDEEGVIQIDGYRPGEVEYDKLVARIDQFNKAIHGNYDPDSPIAIKKTLLGPMLMQFRSWLPESFSQRFQVGMHDANLGREVKGTFRTMAGEDGWQAWGQLPKLLIPFMAKKMTVEGLSSVDESNVRKTAATIRQVMWVSLMMMMLREALDDDDDDSEHIVFAINMMQRVEADLTFFQNPYSIQALSKDALPVFKLARDFAKFTEAVGSSLGGDATIPTGIYAGRSRMLHHGGKLIPFPGAMMKIVRNLDVVQN